MRALPSPRRSKLERLLALRNISSGTTVELRGDDQSGDAHHVVALPRALTSFQGAALRLWSRGPEVELQVLSGAVQLEGRTLSARESVRRALPLVIGAGGDRVSLRAEGDTWRFLAQPVVTLSTERLSVGHAGRVAPQLSEVALDCQSGHAVAIMGPSGAGKSTLLRALAGRDRIIGGTVRLNGMTIDPATSSARAGIGYVAQSNESLLRDLSVRDNLRFALALRTGLTRNHPAVCRRVAEVLEEVDLDDVSDQAVRTLSGGQERRAAIALELLLRPQILLLDEPFSGLSSADVSRLWAVISRIRDEGGVVLFTVHQPSLMLARQFTSLCLVAGGRAAQFSSLAIACHAVGAEAATPEALLERLEHTGLADVGAVEETQTLALATGPVGPNRYRPGFVRNAVTYAARFWSVLIARPSELALALGIPTAIGVLAGVAFTNVGSVQHENDHVLRLIASAPGLLFVLCLSALWLSTQAAAKEIAGEWTVLRREAEVGCPRGSFLAGKYLGLGALVALQALLLVVASQACSAVANELGLSAYTFGSLLDGATLEWRVMAALRVWGVLFASGACGLAMGLTLSAQFRDRVESAVVAVPLVLVFCTLFSGVLPAERWMPAPARALSFVDPARLAFQSALALEMRQDFKAMQRRCGLDDGRFIEESARHHEVFDQVCSMYILERAEAPNADTRVQLRYFSSAVGTGDAVTLMCFVAVVLVWVSVLSFFRRTRNS